MGDGVEDGMWHSVELLAEEPTCTGLVQELRGNTFQHSNLTFTASIRTCMCVQQGLRDRRAALPPSPPYPRSSRMQCASG